MSFSVLTLPRPASSRPKLDQYRIVYFATHGLPAGDVADFAKLNAEPTLVLSLPGHPTEVDDGLLAASEVAQLKLNADWVVLSACNTASAEKPGAETQSGLARAFFLCGGALPNRVELGSQL
jgi:CHAT domain-containing protein